MPLGYNSLPGLSFFALLSRITIVLLKFLARPGGHDPGEETEDVLNGLVRTLVLFMLYSLYISAVGLVTILKQVSENYTSYADPFRVHQQK